MNDYIKIYLDSGYVAAMAAIDEDFQAASSEDNDSYYSIIDFLVDVEYCYSKLQKTRYLLT